MNVMLQHRRKAFRSSFSIGGITGLQMWHKADSLALSDGATIVTWNDSSGNGWTATGVNTPKFRTNYLNGLPVVDLITNPTSHFATEIVTHGIGTGDFFMTAVVQMLSGDYHSVMSNGIYSPAFYLYGLKMSLYFAANHLFDTTMTAGTWYVLSVGRESGTLKGWVNGTQEATTHAGVTASVANTIVQIGNDQGGDYLSSRLAETILVKAAPTANRASAEDVLGLKYGITITH